MQLDNASDNKSRWVLGFFGWVLKQGWCKEIQVSMMMVGHTHEDIDAMFRLIQDRWKRRGCVLSVDAFKELLREAVLGMHTLINI